MHVCVRERAKENSREREKERTRERERLHRVRLTELFEDALEGTGDLALAVYGLGCQGLGLRLQGLRFSV